MKSVCTSKIYDFICICDRNKNLQNVINFYAPTVVAELLIPQLKQLNWKDDTEFQQDGASCHFALRVI